jgi:hypothetical protein
MGCIIRGGPAPSPQDRGVWRTAQLGVRRYDVLDIVPHLIFSM